MKRSVDFRNALGSPDADFERTVISTLNQLKLEESEKAKEIEETEYSDEAASGEVYEEAPTEGGNGEAEE